MTKRTGEEPTMIESVDQNVDTKILTPEHDAYKTNKVSDSTSQTPPDPFSPTATIGDYRIIRKIGEGGMGVVYEAEQQHPRRLVALKVIRGGLGANDNLVKMFEREIEALARLKHPGIASIYESGRSDDGQLFFAMELVQGVELTDFVEKQRSMSGGQPVSVNSQLALFSQIGEVVNYAHQRGIIHRDLKPQNILVTDSGDDLSSLSGSGTGVKILDFGLARINDPEFRGNTDVSQMGQIKGTLLYMSPEQVRGNPDEIDIRSDVYALGVMLYELLSGRMPYDLSKASLPEAMRIICEEPPLSLSQALTETYGRQARIDRDVETIVLKALEKDPDRRYQSVAAMLEDIERYLTNQPILARPPSAFYQFRKLVERHKVAFAGLAIIFVLLSGFGVVMAAQSVRIANERDKAEKARGEAEEQKLEAVKSRNDALVAKNDEAKQREIAVRNLDRAESEQKRAEAALKKAEEQKQLAQQAQLAEAEQRRNAVQNLETARTEKTRAEQQTALALKASQFAGEQRYIAEKSKNEAESRAEENRRLLYVSQMNLAQKAWESADIPRMDEILESQIPKAGQSDLRGFEWKFLHHLSNLQSFTAETTSAAFLPSSDALLTLKTELLSAPNDPLLVNTSTRIKVVDLLNRREIDDLEVPRGYFPLSFSQNGKRLLLLPASAFDVGKTAASISIEVLDIESRQLMAAKIPVSVPPMITLSPNGELLASRAADGTVDIWDLNVGVKRFSVNEKPGAINSMMIANRALPLMCDDTLKFSLNNRVLATAGGNAIVLWDTATGSELGKLDIGKATEEYFFGLALSPDGNTVAFEKTDGVVSLWDVQSKNNPYVLTNKPQHPFGLNIPLLEFSPDGSTLASVSGRTVQLWDLRTKKEVSTIKGSGEQVVTIAFSPNGERLATSYLDPDRGMKTKVWDLPIKETTVVLTQSSNVDLSPDGRTLLTGSSDGKLRQWDFSSLAESGLIADGASNSVYVSPTFAPNGKVFAVKRIDRANFIPQMDFGGTNRGDLEVWDVETGKMIASFGKEIEDMAFSPSSDELVVCKRGSVELWNYTSMQNVSSFSLNGLSVAISPGGRTLAIATAYDVRLVDTVSKREVKLTSKRYVLGSDVSFLSDGAFIAASSAKNVVIWDTAKHTEVAVLRHPDPVTAVKASPDGTRIATVTFDGTIRIWDIGTKQVVISLPTGGKASISSIRFSNDGNSLITSGRNGVRIWRGATDEEVAKQRGK